MHPLKINARDVKKFTAAHLYTRERWATSCVEVV